MELTKQQQKVLDFIEEHVRQKGYPPTVREVAGRFGYRSPMAAKLHIDALVKKGFLRKTPARSRGLEIVRMRPHAGTRIPVLGNIRAGEPILADENVDEYLAVDGRIFRAERGFGLKVIGESMREAGIRDGDIVIVNPEVEPVRGDIVVALLGDEATVKRWYPGNGTVRLQPENPAFAPVVVRAEDVRIVGKVTGLIRRIS